VISWSRTADGWALNLDGTDAAKAFSLPRLEVRSSAQGWISECLLLDGTRRECGSAYLGGLAAAMAGAVEQAQLLLGPGRLAAVLAAGGRGGA
jgi:hypothetical protein